MKRLFICVSLVVAIVIADKCVVYKEGEELPPAPIGGRECFDVWNDSNRYCIDFDCPTPDCSDPITPENGCPFCNGTCIDGGKVHEFGGFECADRCNSCGCSENASWHTQMACTFAEPPKECQ